jgi:hypothetical protein
MSLPEKKKPMKHRQVAALKKKEKELEKEKEEKKEEKNDVIDAVILGITKECGISLFSLEDKPKGTLLFAEKPQHYTSVDFKHEIKDSLKKYASQPAFIMLYELIALNKLHLLEKCGYNPSYVVTRKRSEEGKEDLDNEPKVKIIKEFMKLISEELNASFSFAELSVNLATIKSNIVCGYTMVGLNPLGLGLYEVISKMNHSCYPNCKIYVSSRGIISVYAINDIEKGDELTFDYVGLEALCCLTKRRQRLLVRCGFLCKCTKCTQEEMLEEKGPCKKMMHLNISMKDLLALETNPKVRTALELLEKTKGSDMAQHFRIYFLYWIDIMNFYKRNAMEFMIYHDVIRFLRNIFLIDEDDFKKMKPAITAFSLTVLSRYIDITFELRAPPEYAYGFYWELCLNLVGLLLIVSSGKKETEEEKSLRRLYEVLFYTLVCRVTKEIPLDLELFITTAHNYMLHKVLGDKKNRSMDHKEMVYFTDFLAKQAKAHSEYREKVNEHLKANTEYDEETRHAIQMIDRMVSSLALKD